MAGGDLNGLPGGDVELLSISLLYCTCKSLSFTLWALLLLLRSPHFTRLFVDRATVCSQGDCSRTCLLFTRVASGFRLGLFITDSRNKAWVLSVDMISGH